MDNKSKEIVDIACVLFGRGGKFGRQDVPEKNLRPLLGRPAMTYPLLAAKNSKEVDVLYLSTDDAEIANIGRKLGAEIIDRPDYLATKEALMEDAIFHACGEIKNRLGYIPEIVVVLMCNAPHILASTIDEGVRRLKTKPEFDSVITACKMNMFSPLRARKITEKGTLVPFVPFDCIQNKNLLSSNRNSAGDAYFADNGMTVVRSKCLANIHDNLLPFQWMGKEIHFIEQFDTGCDIDDEWQLVVLERWLANHGFTKTSTPYD